MWGSFDQRACDQEESKEKGKSCPLGGTSTRGRERRGAEGEGGHNEG